MTFPVPHSSEYNENQGRLYNTRLKCPRCHAPIVKQRLIAGVRRRLNVVYIYWCSGCQVRRQTDIRNMTQTELGMWYLNKSARTSDARRLRFDKPDGRRVG